MTPGIQISNIPLATFGDIAASGLGYIAGFVFGLIVNGGDTKSSAEIAAVFAVGCIGIKSLGQLSLAYLGSRKERDNLESLYKETDEALSDLVSALEDRLSQEERSAPNRLQWNHKLWYEGLVSDSEFREHLKDSVYLEAQLRTRKQAQEDLLAAEPADDEGNPANGPEEPAEDEANNKDVPQEPQQDEPEREILRLNIGEEVQEDHHVPSEAVSEMGELSLEDRASLARRLTELIPLRERLRRWHERFDTEGATEEIAWTLVEVLEDLDGKFNSDPNNPFDSIADLSTQGDEFTSSSLITLLYKKVDDWRASSMIDNMKSLADGLALLTEKRAHLDGILRDFSPEALAAALTEDSPTTESLTGATLEVRLLEEAVDEKARFMGEQLAELLLELDDLHIEILLRALEVVASQERWAKQRVERRERMNKRKAVIEALPMEKRRNIIDFLRVQVETFDALPSEEKSEALQQRQEELEELLLQLS